MKPVRYTTKSLAFVVLSIFLGNLAFGQDSANVLSDSPPKTKVDDAKKTAADKPAAAESGGWKSLIHAKGLDGWEITDFGGKGEVTRDGDMLVFDKGDPLCGINSKQKDFPKENYEIELEAQRIEGNDFLCGLTFPVADEFCSLIGGGWGGGLVGLSSIDGYDASENSTSLFYEFKNGEWYKFRLRVDDKFVTAWINDKEIIKQERDGHEFSTRIEVYVSRPLGYCVFQSKVALRNFRWRPATSH